MLSGTKTRGGLLDRNLLKTYRQMKMEMDRSHSENTPSCTARQAPDWNPQGGRKLSRPNPRGEERWRKISHTEGCPGGKPDHFTGRERGATSSRHYVDLRKSTKLSEVSLKKP